VLEDDTLGRAIGKAKTVPNFIMGRHDANFFPHAGRRVETKKPTRILLKAITDFCCDDNLFALAATGLAVSMMTLFSNVTKSFGSRMTNALLFFSAVKR